jgi:hypothetical protein
VASVFSQVCEAAAAGCVNFINEAFFHEFAMTFFIHITVRHSKAFENIFINIGIGN